MKDEEALLLTPLTAKDWAGVVFDAPEIPMWGAPKTGQLHYYATDALQLDRRRVERALYKELPFGTLIMELGIYATGEGHFLQVHTIYSPS